MFQVEFLLRCSLPCGHLCCGVTVPATHEQHSILGDPTGVIISIIDKIVADTPAAIGPGQASVTSAPWDHRATAEEVTILQ